MEEDAGRLTVRVSQGLDDRRPRRDSDCHTLSGAPCVDTYEGEGHYEVVRSLTEVFARVPFVVVVFERVRVSTPEVSLLVLSPTQRWDLDVRLGVGRVTE